MKFLPLVTVAASAGSASAQSLLSGLSGLGGASSTSGISSFLAGLTSGASSSASADPMAGMDMSRTSGTAAPHTSIPAGVQIEPRLESTAVKDGGVRVTVDYGPYILPPNGMISMPSLGAKTPCSNCFITGMQAKISYLDGAEANIDTGAWLHHMVIAKGITPIFASGNERTPLRINNHYKYGIEMGALDTFVMLVDLMSASNELKQVKLQILYEYIPKDRATGYKNMFMKWNDVGQPSAKEGVYKFETISSRMGATGRLLYTNGHVHDGGTETKLFVNNKEVCKSTMLYGRRPGFLEAAGAAGHAGHGGKAKRDGAGGLHISDSSTCQDFGNVNANDQIRVEAWYDSNKYPLMEHNGKKERLMGIMRVYVGA